MPPRLAYLGAFLALTACTPRSPGAAASSSSHPRSTAPAPPASSAPDDASWEGILVEHRPEGIVYINDANARDSTAAFEAVLIPDALLAEAGESVPARAKPWSPSVGQLLEAGVRIATYVDEHAPGNTPMYRYRLAAFLVEGKPLIRATALCDSPAWWQARLPSSTLCQSVGSCRDGMSALQGERRDCAFQFSYDPAARELRRD